MSAIEEAKGIQSSDISPVRRPQHTGEEVASILSKARAMVNAEPGDKKASIRGLSRQEGVAESTIRYWMRRKLEHQLEAETVVFLESPAGVRFLKRQMDAQLFVFGLMGSCGPHLHRRYIRLAGLHTFVASSNTTLQGRMRKLMDIVVAYGKQARTDLGKVMPRRKVSLGVDETFFDEMVLVAMDVASDFIITEKRSAHRDTDTWEKHVRLGIEGLNVELVQVVGDGAKSLTALAKDRLGIPKVEDLWHGQNAITRGTAGALASKVEAESTQLDRTCKVWGRVVDRRKEYYRNPRGRGRPPEWAAHEAHAKHKAEAAESALYLAVENQQTMRQCVCDLGTILHPVDLNTGELQDAAKVEGELQKTFDRMEVVVKEAGLGERSQTALLKAKRLLPSWVASVKQWHERLKECLTSMKLPATILLLLSNVLIPLIYIRRVLKQTRDSQQREKLKKIEEKLQAAFAESLDLWRDLPTALRRSVLAAAHDCVDLFQRSTGCVEGRNGVLSLHQHHMRGLNSQTLAALTVVHNFVATRSDGSTAASRFFGRMPNTPLFDHIFQAMPPLPRPRKRSSRSLLDPLISSVA